MRKNPTIVFVECVLRPMLKASVSVAAVAMRCNMEGTDDAESDTDLGGL